MNKSNLPDELRELMKDLPDILDSLEERIGLDSQASKLAHDSLDQFHSVTIDKWDHTSGEKTTDELEKLVGNDLDVVVYGKAIRHIQSHVRRSIDKARKSPYGRIRQIVRPKDRKRADTLEDMLMTGATQVIMMRIKRDIMDKYELVEKDKKNVRR